MKKISSSIYEYIISIVPKEQVHLDEPMAMHTTFRVGGECKALICIDSEEELSKLVPYLKSIDAQFFIKGNGSNLLISDRGYDGIILELSDKFDTVTIKDELIEASAGALMSSIASKAAAHGLGGFEFASGIPGTIGGGVVMNAGAYGGELKDVVEKVRVMTDRGEIMTLDRQAMRFDYRYSIVKDRPFIVLSVALRLQEEDPQKIRDKMKEFNESRRAKQPLEYPSAGSTFKRPEGYFAGKLIMDAGLRGFNIGNAAVSEKHCGFVINKGNASATDIYDVIVEVRQRVWKKFGVKLEPEVIMLGEF